MPKPSGAALPLSAVKLDAPIPVPRRNIFCVGLNYRAHATEFANSGVGGQRTTQQVVPEFPVIFSKVPECVIAPEAAIRIPNGLSSSIDYEAELAVVIGKTGTAIAPSRAMEHVWGYTIVNDVTARDLQRRHQQWLLGKSLDTFAPMGPWLACTNELDGSHTRVRCWVNDELRQDAPTERPDLRHPDPDLDHLGRHHALPGRHHRHRHALGRRHRLRPAQVPAPRRSRAHPD